MATDINNASGADATGTSYSGLTSANYGITSPYVMQQLGRAQAAYSTPYQAFRIPQGITPESARVAGMDPMETRAYQGIGSMNFQQPMQEGMDMTRGAAAGWGAGTASPYMSAYNQAVGGGNPMYNQAMSGLAGLDFQRGMARGMGGTEAVLGSSFASAGNPYLESARSAMGPSAMMNKAGATIGAMNAGSAMQRGMGMTEQAGQGTFAGQQNQYLDPMKQAVGTSSLLNQGNAALGSMNAGAGMQGAFGNLSAASSGQFGQQANQYLDPMRQQVGTSAGLNKATQALGGIDTGNIMQQGMGMMTGAGTSQFGAQQANQYLNPMRQAVGTNAGLNAATQAFGQAGGAQGMQQGMQRLSQLGESTFGQEEAKKYMSPYQQQVVEQQKQEAIRDYQKQQPGQSAAAFQAGAGRGTRSALLQAEAQRNLQNQLGDIQAKGSQAAFENAQKMYGEDAARRMQAAQSQISSGTDITGRQAQLGTEDLARKQQQYETAARLYGEDTARKLTAGQSAVNAAADITRQQAQLGTEELARRQQQYDAAQAQYNADKARQMQGAQTSLSSYMDLAGRQTQAGESELNRRQQQYDAAMAQYNADKARQAAAGQATFGQGSDIYGKQYQYGADEQARNRDIYNTAMGQYNTEMQNRLAASGQLFNQAGDIYNRQYTAGDTQQQRQIDAYNRSMDQFNAEQNRRMGIGQQLYGMGTDIYGRQIAGGEAQRAQRQKVLDAMYEDFQQERDYPQKQIAGMMGVLGQVPQYSDYSTKAYQTAAPVDPAAAKAAAAGLGLDTLQKAGGASGIWEQLKGLFGG